MKKDRQTTLKNRVTLSGVGLHSGSKVRCVLHPAPANHGIVFVRSDLSSLPHVKADISKVARTDMCTTLGQEGVYVATVEHLLSALSGMGVDNVLVELNAPEVPIMDGSAIEFVDAIQDAGIRDLSLSRKILRLKESVSLRIGDKWIEATPSENLEIKGSISFAHRMIGDQIFRYSIDKNFAQEIAGARTFGFLKEVEYLHKKGLALGGSLDNAIVLDEQNVLNPEGLRFKNEFIRHKILDAIGDFALLGISMQASIEIHKSGHELHTAFLRKVLSDPSCYEIVEASNSKSSGKDHEEESEAIQMAHAF